MKHLLALVVLLPAAAARAQDLDKTITLNLPATNAKAALAAMSESGTKFEPSAALANEPLILSVRGATLRDLMQRIATAMSAEWERTSEGFRLTRSASLLRSQENADLAARTAALKQSLTEYVATEAKSQEWDETIVRQLVETELKRREEMAQAISGNVGGEGSIAIASSIGSSSASPANIALYEVLKTINAKDLAAIAPGTRVVFSAKPTAMQRPASFDSNRAMNRFVEAHNLLARVAAPVDGSRRPNMRFLGGLDLEAKPIVAPLSKLLLIVTRPTAEGPLQVQLKIADESGTIVGTTSTSLAFGSFEAGSVPTAGAQPITLSEESKELARLINEVADDERSVNTMVTEINGERVVLSSAGAEATRPISRGLLDKLVKPEQFDPLGYFVAETLMQAASARGENLVASPPDAAFLRLARLLTSTANTDQVLKSLPGADVRSEAGWLVIGARSPASARAARFDRKALGALLTRTLANGYARLDEIAAYAVSLPPALERIDADRAILRLISPQTEQEFAEMLLREHAMLKLYGLLSNDQKRILATGRTLIVGGLTPAQKVQAGDIVFNRLGGPMFGGGRPGSRTMVMSATFDGGDGPPAFGPDTLAKEPTEAFPNGLPPTAVIAISPEERGAVFAKLAESRDGKFFTAAELGIHNAMAEQMGESQARFNAPTFVKFKAATKVVMNWTLQLGEERLDGGQMRDAWASTHAPEVTYDGLPAEFREAVLEAAKRMRNVRLGAPNAPPPSSP